MSTRFRTSDYATLRPGYAPAIGTGISEFITEVPFRKGLQHCTHRKVLAKASGMLGIRSNVEHTISGHLFQGESTSMPDSVIQQCNTAWVNHLKGDAENNDFEILTFMTDLDDTLAMFSKKFLRELSYGSFTWGILPFVSDLQAMVSSLRDLFGRYKTYPKCTRIYRRKPILYSKPFDGTLLPPRFEVLFVQGHAQTSGYLTLQPFNADPLLGKLQFLLDEIGFHPDLKTAWDTIPFSFVVDYFIPVGDILESLHPRGWGSSQYTFTGSQSFSCKFFVYYQDGSWQGGTSEIPAMWDHYQRTCYYDTPTASLRGEPVWSAPSFKELFNTAYLTGLLRPAERFAKRL